MKFVTILPTTYINERSFLSSNTILILAHLVEKNPEYMRECKKFFGVRILDNSFFELRNNPYTIEELIALGNMSNAQILCLPDLKYKSKKQFKTTITNMAIKTKFAGFKTMAVVTCDKNFDIEMKEFKILNSIKEVDIIAIPYVFRKGDDMKRWMFLDRIEKEVGLKKLKKEYHLFGCNSCGNIKKEKRSWIHSIDGTMPFKEGWFNQLLPVSVKKEHKRPSNYFNIKRLNERQRKSIKYNVSWIKNECEK